MLARDRSDLTLLALGKAAVPMALGARQALGSQIAREVVVAPEPSALLLGVAAALGMLMWRRALR